MNNLAPMKNFPGGMQGNQYWMLGYKIYEKILSGGLEVSLSIL